MGTVRVGASRWPSASAAVKGGEGIGVGLGDWDGVIRIIGQAHIAHEAF